MRPRPPRRRRARSTAAGPVCRSSRGTRRGCRRPARPRGPRAVRSGSWRTRRSPVRRHVDLRPAARPGRRRGVRDVAERDIGGDVAARDVGGARTPGGGGRAGARCRHRWSMLARHRFPPGSYGGSWDDRTALRQASSKLRLRPSGRLRGVRLARVHRKARQPPAAVRRPLDGARDARHLPAAEGRAGAGHTGFTVIVAGGACSQPSSSSSLRCDS